MLTETPASSIRGKLPSMKIQFLFFAAIASFSATAQQDASPEKVARTFLGTLSTSDSSLARTLMFTDFELKTVARKGGGDIILLQEDPQEFLQAVGSKHKESWEERISNVIVHTDGDLSVIWCDYEFYVDGSLSHKGIDVFQLIHTPSGWKIFSICDTRKKN